MMRNLKVSSKAVNRRLGVAAVGGGGCLWMTMMMFMMFVWSQGAVATARAATSPKASSPSTSTSWDAIPNDHHPVQEKQNDVDVWTIPTFTMDDLLYGRRVAEFSSVLSTTGIFAIQPSPPTEDDMDDDELKMSFVQARSTAFSGLCACTSSASFLNDIEGTNTVQLKDGITTRTSLATATLAHGKTPLSIPSHLGSVCGTETLQAMEQLRDYVDEVSSTFVQAWDQLLLQLQWQHLPPIALLETTDGIHYPTISSIVQASTNLEHFHVYNTTTTTAANNGQEQQNSASAGPQSSSPTLDWHMDAGLFLSFVHAYDCSTGRENNHGDDNDRSFFIRDVQGKPHAVRIPNDSVVIMLGMGAEQWLLQQQQQQQEIRMKFRATRHAMDMKQQTHLAQSSSSEKQQHRQRAWYGTMHLVPDNAIIQNFPHQQQQRTFGDMRRAMAMTSTRSLLEGARNSNSNNKQEELEFEEERKGMENDGNHARDATIGCGNVFEDDDDDDGAALASGTATTSTSRRSRRHRRRLDMVDDASACNNVTNFYCWMSCLEIPNARYAEEYINRGYSLYCLDPSEFRSSSSAPVEGAVQPCLGPYGVPGAVMNEACIGSWQPTQYNVPSQEIVIESNSTGNHEHDHGDMGMPGMVGDEELFCWGGTSMYMDGFNWVGSTCVIYLFRAWTLYSPGLFLFACFVTILFGVGLEYAIHQRRQTMESLEAGMRRLVYSAGFYGLQLTLGYTIMLVVMIYSAPLFISVILGIVSGHVLFNAQDAIFKPKTVATRRRRPSPNELDGDDHDEEQRTNRSSKGTLNRTSAGSDEENVSGDISDLFQKKRENPDTASTVPEGITPCCQNQL